MWVKRPESKYYQKVQQQLGFVLAFAANLVLVGVISLVVFVPDWAYADEFILLSPWVLNIGLILGGFVFRPQIGTGVLYFWGMALLIPILFSMLAVASCLVSLPFLIFGPGYGIALLAIFLFGLGWMWKNILQPITLGWWRDYGVPDNWVPPEKWEPPE